MRSLPGVFFVTMMAAGGLLAGCGPPPEFGETPPPPRSPGTPAPASPAIPGPPLPGTDPRPTASPGFSEDRAVDCDGHPDADTVLALLRDEGVLAAGGAAEVTEGPVCAGTWQYTVVGVPDLDPLQAVTRDDPAGSGGLTLVTAGTDVCTVDVRLSAPPGIRDTADCVG